MNKPSYKSGALQVEAHRTLQHYVSTEVKKFNINTTQWFIIGQIKENSDIIAADLAAKLKVDAPLITLLTEDLVKKGLINKVPHAKDRRVKCLQLTITGSELVTTIEKSLRAVLLKLLKGVSADELKVYEKVLLSVVTNGQHIA